MILIRNSVTLRDQKTFHIWRLKQFYAVGRIFPVSIFAFPLTQNIIILDTNTNSNIIKSDIMKAEKSCRKVESS